MVGAERSAVVRYGAAILISAAFVLLRIVLNPFLGDQQSPYVIFLAGIMLSAWFGGVGPGVLATILTALAADYFFVGVRGKLFDLGLAETLRTHVYVADGLFISWLAGQLRTAVQRSRRNEAELALADRRKDDFLAILAHELRSPLAPLSHGLELLKRSQADPDAARETVAMMDRQMQLMMRLVDDLLDVARIRQGKVSLHKEIVPLAEIVSRAVELCQPMIDGRRHRLDLDLPAEPIWVDADPIRLTQVLTNLLTNAAKYTPEGGRIHLSVSTEQGDVLICVRDNGIGIPADRLPHIFELFHQAGESPAQTQAGLGLGLAVVRSLVRSHGGSIVAWSDGPGRGSEFTVRLPTVDCPEGERHDATHFRTETADAGAVRVLIVDDSLDTAQALARLLRFDGHETKVVPDGPGALASAAAWRPDVVLLDISLPGMDGYEVARQLRGQPAGTRPLLVAMTGHGRPDDLRRADEAGFDHHLLKPVRLEHLQALLAAAAAL